MNKQEIFNNVVNHARKQGKKSLSDLRRFCMYRAPDGSKCFMGCLIPDNLYDPNMERHGISTYLEDGSVAKFFQGVFDHLGVENIEDRQFLVELQRIHDGSDLIYWEKKFEDFAKEYDLNLPLLTNILDKSGDVKS